MNMSLIPHIAGYRLTTEDLCLCALTFFTALPFAARHFELANEPYTAKWGHRILAVIECMPILGALVALIEYYIASRGVFPDAISERVFEKALCVIESQRPSQTKRQQLEKTLFGMLQQPPRSIHFPKKTKMEWAFSTNRNRYCIMTQGCTPEEFEQIFQKEAARNVFGKYHWLEMFYEGETALHWAVHSGRIELIKYILSGPRGEQLLNRSSLKGGDTPLMTAMQTQFISPQANREEIVELLLQSKADPNLFNRHHCTSLWVALTTGQLSLTQRLLLHPTAAILSFITDPLVLLPPVSERGRAVLLAAYQQIESALAEGLQLTILCKDVHSIIAGYYWRFSLPSAHTRSFDAE